LNNQKSIVNLVYAVIDEVNMDLPSTQKLKKSLDTQLYGDKSEIDSLSLVNVVVLTEQKIEDEFNITINLADEKAMSQKNSPFRTIETFVEYIEKSVNEK
jgi:D-alanine--poly(phosphoribitol) ligase subunit 2